MRVEFWNEARDALITTREMSEEEVGSFLKSALSPTDLRSRHRRVSLSTGKRKATSSRLLQWSNRRRHGRIHSSGSSAISISG